MEGSVINILTENCNILSNLIPGDTILADRGFDTKETVGLYCATITMPAFTKGKKQLSGEVEQSRQITNVRIHVERVIGLIRQKYQILQGTQPVEFVTPKDNSTLLDKVVSVSCSLIMKKKDVGMTNRFSKKYGNKG